MKCKFCENELNSFRDSYHVDNNQRYITGKYCTNCGYETTDDEARITELEQAARTTDELLNHIKDVLIGRGFTDPLVQEIQAYFLNQGKP